MKSRPERELLWNRSDFRFIHKHLEAFHGIWDLKGGMPLFKEPLLKYTFNQDTLIRGYMPSGEHSILLGMPVITYFTLFDDYSNNYGI